jgi:thiamine pyrophosphokinase
MVGGVGHGRSLASGRATTATIGRMQVVVIADGAVGSRAALDATWPGWLSTDALVVAADGGARHAPGLGLGIDRWVGDGDSLGEAGVAELVAAGIPVDRFPPDKDQSDTELAIVAALERRPSAITILGALGGPRVDHALANLTLLSMPALAGVDVRIVAVDARVRLLQAAASSGSAARLDLEGRIGDLVTLLPIGGDVVGVSVSGLAFPLAEETLREGLTRGLSNRRTVSTATVALRSGRLLVVETPATL